MAYYTRDSNGNLVPSDFDVPEEAISVIERADSEAIVQAMTSGVASDKFIYEYPINTKDGKKWVVGISSVGADEIARQMRNLETLNDYRIDKESDPDYIYAGVRVRDIVTNVTLLGVGRQCKFVVGAGNLPLRDRIDEHAFVKAVTKGQRNGILHQAPADAVLKIINELSKKGKVKQLVPPTVTTAPAVRTTQQQPPPPPAKAPVTTQAPAQQDTTQAQELVKAAEEQQEKLKNMRQKVHLKFKDDLGIDVEPRKAILASLFDGKTSLLQLNEQELQKCLEYIESEVQKRSQGDTDNQPVQPATQATQPTGTTPSSPIIPGENPDVQAQKWGFTDAKERNDIRAKLFNMITGSPFLGLSNEEAKEYTAKYGVISTLLATKDKLNEIIKAVEQAVKVKNQLPDF